LDYEEINKISKTGFLATKIADELTAKCEPTVKGFEVAIAFLRPTRHEEPVLEKQLGAWTRQFN
jgi:hypothetical protein